MKEEIKEDIKVYDSEGNERSLDIGVTNEKEKSNRKVIVSIIIAIIILTFIAFVVYYFVKEYRKPDTPPHVENPGGGTDCENNLESFELCPRPFEYCDYNTSSANCTVFCESNYNSNNSDPSNVCTNVYCDKVGYQTSEPSDEICTAIYCAAKNYKEEDDIYVVDKLCARSICFDKYWNDPAYRNNQSYLIDPQCSSWYCSHPTGSIIPGTDTDWSTGDIAKPCGLIGDEDNLCEVGDPECDISNILNKDYVLINNLGGKIKYECYGSQQWCGDDNNWVYIRENIYISIILPDEPNNRTSFHYYDGEEIDVAYTTSVSSNDIRARWIIRQDPEDTLTNPELCIIESGVEDFKRYSIDLSSISEANPYLVCTKDKFLNGDGTSQNKVIIVPSITKDGYYIKTNTASPKYLYYDATESLSKFRLIRDQSFDPLDSGYVFMITSTVSSKPVNPVGVGYNPSNFSTESVYALYRDLSEERWYFACGPENGNNTWTKVKYRRGGTGGMWSFRESLLVESAGGNPDWKQMSCFPEYKSDTGPLLNWDRTMISNKGTSDRNINTTYNGWHNVGNKGDRVYIEFSNSSYGIRFISEKEKSIYFTSTMSKNPNRLTDSPFDAMWKESVSSSASDRSWLVVDDITITLNI